jgi:hypothetical protein
MTESLNVGRDGRADILPFEPGRVALQAQEPTCSRECRVEAAADSAAAPGARSGPVHQQRSPVLHPVVSLVSVSSQGHDDYAARDCDALAARGISPLLALEIAEPGRSAEDRRRFAGIDPADEH